jgi:ribonucleoside-diphosphate reductase alpha chain
MGASHAEKSTIADGRLNAVKGAPTAGSDELGAPLPKACSITDPDCEACQ